MADFDAIQWRVALLEKFDTGNILKRIPILENELQKLLEDELAFKKENVGFIASMGTDCSEVKRIEAEITLQAEGKNAEARKAWVERQRTENQELKSAIEKQNSISFQLEDFNIRIEMTKKRLDSLLAILELKTSQIHFLGS